ncbi:MAG: hypothetical protein ACLFVG_02595 [Candidatus Aminicenantes bacterium]
MDKKSIIFVALGFLSLTAGMFLFLDFPVDDSFIHLQFARHLREDGHFFYNYGHPVNAVTSPLWVLFISLGSFLLQLNNYYSAAQILNALLILAAACMFLIFCLKIFTNRTAACVVFVIFCLHPWILRWSINGVEVPLSVFLIFLGLNIYADIYLLSKSSILKNIAWGLVMGLSILARPENMVLVVILFVVVLFTRSYKQTGFASFLSSIGSCFFIVCSWLIFSFYEFGTIMPTSFLTKTKSTVSFTHFLSWIKTNGPLLLASHPVEWSVLLGSIILFLFTKNFSTLKDLFRGQKAAAMVWLLFPGIVFMFYNLKGVLMYSRYVANFSPVVILLGGFLAERTIHAFIRSEKMRNFLLMAFFTVYLVYSISFIRVVLFPKSLVAVNRPRNNVLYSISRDLDRKQEKENKIRVAVTEAGIIKYFAANPQNRFLIDLTGLVSPEYYRYSGGGNTTALLNQSKPDYIVLMEWQKKAFIRGGPCINLGRPDLSKLKGRITHLKSYAVIRDDENHLSLRQMPFLGTNYETYRVAAFKTHFYSLYKLRWDRE